MKARRSYLPGDSVYPLLGLNTLDPSTLSSPRYGTVADNCTFYKGVLAKRHGYRLIGDQSALPSEPVMAVCEFISESGARTTVAVTTSKQFKYDSTADEWVDITAKHKKISFKYAAAGTFTVGEPVTQASSGATGKYMSKDGTYVYLSYVSGTFDATNTLTGGTSGATATAHGSPQVVETAIAGNSYPWTGGEFDVVDWTIGTDGTGKYLYITNGVDTPLRWNDSLANFQLVTEADGWDYPNFVTAKSVAVFQDVLWFGNVTTTSAEETLVAWSDTADFGNFNPTGSNAGANLLADARGPVWKLMQMGERLVIYCQNSIHLISYVGTPDVFAFEQLAENTQMLSPRSMVNLGAFHLFAGRENIYLFDGTRQVRPVGDRIQRQYREDLLLDDAGLAHAFLDTIEQRCYFTIPSDTDASRTYVLEYNLNNFAEVRWGRFQYAGRPFSFGYVTTTETPTWDSEDVSLTWDTASDIWYAPQARAGFPVRLIGQDGAIVVDDEVDSSDDGAAIEAVWESIDFTLPGDYVSAYARFIEIEVELRGTSVDVYTSTEQGAQPTFRTTLTLTGAWAKYTVPIDTVGRSIRVRLRHGESSGGFEMRFLRIWYRSGGAR